MVRSNSHDFEGQGRVLRLKQYVNSDVRPAAINAILEALAVNTLVEVLYIQNFEQVSRVNNNATSIGKTPTVQLLLIIVARTVLCAMRQTGTKICALLALL